MNATATDKVKGWVSKEVGWSPGLKMHYQTSILSKLVEEMWSYFMAFIFFYAERTRNNFLVGIIQTSNIFCTKRVEVKIDWMGERKV